MFDITRRQRFNLLIILTIFHIAVIIASNYLVQYPITILSIPTTWGAFTFPLIFLATDLTVRIFGASLARKIIFWVMLPALLSSYTISTLFYDTQWQGLSALNHFNLSVGRIALASFSAYLLGQLIDIKVFNRLRQLKQWWIAPTISTTFGNFIDTIAFFFIAFYQSSDPYMAEHWVILAFVDCASKILISLVFFLPTYGLLLNFLLKHLPQQKKC